MMIYYRSLSRIESGREGSCGASFTGPVLSMELPWGDQFPRKHFLTRNSGSSIANTDAWPERIPVKGDPSLCGQIKINFNKTDYITHQRKYPRFAQLTIIMALYR
jgi:hypothetical protein